MHDWHQAEELAERAERLLSLGRGPEAERALRDAIEIDPSRGGWHATLAIVQESLGRLEEALASMRQAAALLPDDPRPQAAAASYCLRLGRLEEAVELASRAAAHEDTDELAPAILISALHRLDRGEDAELAYYEAQQRFEEMPACLVAMGDLQAEAGAYDRASWCYREAMRQAPEMPGLRGRIADLLASTGRPERALQLHLAELRENPASIESLLASGRLMVVLERRTEALDRFRRVLEIEPANIDAHWEIGMTALSMRRFDEARSEFELVRRLDPDTPLVRRRLAEALLGEGRIDAARTELREALLRLAEDESATERQHLAALLLDVGLPELARPLLEALSIEDPDDLETLRRLAACRYRTGDRSNGCVISRRILRRDPRCIRSMHNLALAALEEERFLSAFNWMRRGLAIDPTDRGLRRIRSRLWPRWLWSVTLGLPVRTRDSIRRRWERRGSRGG